MVHFYNRLGVQLIEKDNDITHGKDRITLKAESVSPLTIQRNPIIIPLPGGSICGIDLGRNNAVISVAGVVDYQTTELYLVVSSGFSVGETITGNSGYDIETSPHRTSTPTALITGLTGDPSDPTGLIISGLDPQTFFVDTEVITGNGGGIGVVTCPLPSKRRLEQVARYWYSSGLLTLSIGDEISNPYKNPAPVTYQGYISGFDFNMMAGLEDRYQFRMTFVEGVQGLPEPTP